MGLISMLKNLFGGETDGATPSTGSVGGATDRSPSTNPASDMPVAVAPVSLPMTEEEKTEVAIISAVIAGQHHPGAKFHVTQITRLQ